MSKRKAPSGQQLKQIRSQLAQLKKAGLYTGDVRNAKGGWRQKSIIKQYSDVLSGKAKSVKVGKAARDFDPSYRAKNKRVVVKAEKGETFRYSKTSGGIISTVERYGIKFKRILPGKVIRRVEDLPRAKRKGKKYLYKLPHNPILDYDGMKQEFIKYANKKGYGEAIEIYEVDAADFPDEEDLDDE